MPNRIELIILTQSTIDDIDINEDIGSIYIAVNEESISYTRSLLNQLYTTRIMLLSSQFYIYGKKKGNKGVFNEHCKNTVIEKEDIFKYLIEVSSNENDIVLSDNENILNKAQKLNRGILCL